MGKIIDFSKSEEYKVMLTTQIILVVILGVVMAVDFLPIIEKDNEWFYFRMIMYIVSILNIALYFIFINLLQAEIKKEAGI